MGGTGGCPGPGRCSGCRLAAAAHQPASQRAPLGCAAGGRLRGRHRARRSLRRRLHPARVHTVPRCSHTHATPPLLSPRRPQVPGQQRHPQPAADGGRVLSEGCKLCKGRQAHTCGRRRQPLQPPPPAASGRSARLVQPCPLLSALLVLFPTHSLLLLSCLFPAARCLAAPFRLSFSRCNAHRFFTGCSGSGPPAVTPAGSL